MTDQNADSGRPARALAGCRVLIADDHDLFRETLSLYLQIEGKMEAVLAGSLSEAREILDRDTDFDVVLLDYMMPGMTGLDGLVALQSDYPGPRYAIISGTASREIAEEALACGAAGFLPKTLSARTLVNAVRFIEMGEQYAPLEFMRAEEAPHPLAEQLSQREMEVLRCLTEGKSNKEIARDLDIREPTVKLHLKTLFRKIGASNRTIAAMIAREQGLF
ncbi:response regulator transcription factor [Acidimangrovimonas sediminis]|uniref:response regulator transcription factor n=1 Tax=Acidimangrovimonas sediminis TaxID=2056283 RepID=UPI000C7FABF0|nr:response regulator transcription factor [Acidimangrovimonas sediminis]